MLETLAPMELDAQAPLIPMTSDLETHNRATFNALMWALSNPGRIFNLIDKTTTLQSCLAIADCLLDLESTFFTHDVQLRIQLMQRGARFELARHASYHFYPALGSFSADSVGTEYSEQMLEFVAQASVGTPLYPDASATMIVACQLGQGRLLSLRGPGIETVNKVQIDGLSENFWKVRTQKLNYPLGIDLFLIDANQLIGIPRTTSVEME